MTEQKKEWRTYRKDSRVPVSVVDIAKGIKSRLSDGKIDQIISRFLQYTRSEITVDEYKKNNYAQLRRWAYPDVGEFLDIMVKIHSGDASLKKEGDEQLAGYSAKCLKVKERFQKL